MTRTPTAHAVLPSYCAQAVVPSYRPQRAPSATLPDGLVAGGLSGRAKRPHRRGCSCSCRICAGAPLSAAEPQWHAATACAPKIGGTATADACCMRRRLGCRDVWGLPGCCREAHWLQAGWEPGSTCGLHLGACGQLGNCKARVGAAKRLQQVHHLTATARHAKQGHRGTWVCSCGRTFQMPAASPPATLERLCHSAHELPEGARQRVRADGEESALVGQWLGLGVVGRACGRRLKLKIRLS